MNSEYVEYIGYIAASLTTIAFFPQVYQVYKTQKTDDLSLSMFVIFTVGILCWLTYGILIKNIPIVLADTISLSTSIYILYIKIKNELHKR